MSTLSEEARAKAKDKAERLVRSDPRARVDASGYSPEGAMDADIQTGPRPISRRQFRRGGKVAGEASAPRADRKPRANGGRLTADSLINRDVKAANEERPGTKHIGGMKTGGRTGKFIGGGMGAQAMGGRPGGAMPTGPQAGGLGAQAAAAQPAAQPVASPRPVMGGMPMNRKDGGRTSHASGCECAKCGGGRVGKKAGGAINDGTRPTGGRLARKGGGRTKKGTNVNIIITQPGGMARPPMPMPPPGAMPPPGLHQGAPPPMAPPPGAMPPGGPPPVMPRKSGGRTLEKDGGKLAKPGRYPIDSGAGGGLGRLEKAERAARS